MVITDVDVTNAIVSCLAMADRKRALDLYFLDGFVADDIKGLFGIQGVFFNWASPEFAKCWPVSN